MTCPCYERSVLSVGVYLCGTKSLTDTLSSAVIDDPLASLPTHAPLSPFLGAGDSRNTAKCECAWQSQWDCLLLFFFPHRHNLRMYNQLEILPTHTNTLKLVVTAAAR